MLLLNDPELMFNKCFVRIAKLCIFCVLGNIMNIYVKYFYSGPIHLKSAT